MESAMFMIRIIRIPAGEAPEHIREAWVGVVLPCIGQYQSDAIGVLSKKVATSGGNDFHVRQDAALRVLERERPEAAAWWKAQGFPRIGRCFAFFEYEAARL